MERDVTLVDLDGQQEACDGDIDSGRESDPTATRNPPAGQNELQRLGLNVSFFCIISPLLGKKGGNNFCSYPLSMWEPAVCGCFCASAIDQGNAVGVMTRQVGVRIEALWPDAAVAE